MGSGGSSQRYKSHADKEREAREKQERNRELMILRQARRDQERKRRATKDAWLQNYRAATPKREGLWQKLVGWWKENMAWAKYSATHDDEGFPMGGRRHQD